MCMTTVYMCGVSTVNHCKWFKSLVSCLVYFPGYLTLMTVSWGCFCHNLSILKTQRIGNAAKKNRAFELQGT